MIKHLRKLPIKFSWLWLPYLLMLPYVPLTKVVWYIFLILSIHEMAHVLCAFLFKYKIESIIIYPFGLAAQISDIGLGSVYKEVIILAAGPLTHLMIPSMLLDFQHYGFISQPFCAYLCMMNASLLLFNLLPVYPLDGGRILQTFFHCFLPFRKANIATFLCSFLFLFILISMSILNGFSAYIIFVFLSLQIFLAWKQLSFTTLKFYHYRYLHPVNYTLLLHEKRDLYRSRYNVIKVKKGWMKEEQWLHTKFFQNKSRR